MTEDVGTSRDGAGRGAARAGRSRPPIGAHSRGAAPRGGAGVRAAPAGRWPGHTSLLALAGATLGSLVVHAFEDGRARWLAAIVAVTILVLAVGVRRRWSVPGWVVLVGVGLAQVLGGVHLLSDALPELVPAPWATLLVVGAVALLAVGLDALRDRPWLGAASLPTLLVLAAAVGGALVLRHRTGIDVLMFQEVSAGRLLDGIDPYGGVYEHDYSPGAVDQFYGPGLAEGGRLRFGFPYPPLSLLLVLPGALLGDVRIVHLLAVLVTGAAIWHVRVADPRLARLGTVVFLTSPLSYFVASRAWTEPLVLVLAVLLLLHRTHTGRLHRVLLGLLLAVKQYVVLLLPLLLLLRSPTAKARDVVRLLAGAVVTVAVVTLPFFLWNPERFWFSVVELQFLQPFRPDSLSLLAFSVEHLGWPPEALYGLLPFAAAAIVTGAILWRRRGRAGLYVAVWGSALLLLAMFLVSKQAFSNYYFLAFGFLCLAIATSGEPDTVRDEELATVLHDP